MSKKIKNIEVAVRMRPLIDNFQDHEAWIADSQQKIVSSIPKKMFGNSHLSSNDQSNISIKKRTSKIIQKNNIYEFSYDYVFQLDQKNDQVYTTSCKPLVQQFLKGKNASIFMYGQTTSGKTYTMLGGNNEQGLIIFSLKDIFKHFEMSENTNSSVIISYMEIYNEQINDLLNPEGLNLRVADDSVQNLTQYQISSFKQAFELLERGEKVRSYAQKNFHDHSSRSHTIFQIKLISYAKVTGKIISKNVLNLVDLAGSERVGQEDSNEETGYINKSLFILSNVIHKLCQKKIGHIPFRDSKLTRVLSSSLTTSSQTIFICTISPAEINFTQTLSTLRFANQSRKVELKSVEQSLILNESSFILQQKQISKLKEENVCLKKNLSDKQKSSQIKAPISILRKTMQKLQDLIVQHDKQNNSSNEPYRRRQSVRHTKSQNSLTLQKIQNLYSQYQRNVQTLQKEYIKAMINLTSSDMKISKDQIKKRIIHEEFPDNQYFLD